ncbi:MAG TPA: 5-(carboxyamino)imidazole ribonucleotide synthase [Blastocatellia bacterium]|nr:5-(carboxyamino)imidazole ribonucleotide synthase [Blastocatellia bacterium]
MILGLLGGGQLGRMLALAGYPLGLRFRVLDLSPAACAGQMAELIVGDYNDLDALKRFASGLDLVTYEFENVPVSSARFLQRRLPVFPLPEALEAGQDRLVEKRFFQDLAIPTPLFMAVENWEEMERAAQEIGLPSVLKTRRYGYDGKGQYILKQPEDAALAWRAFGGVPLILEQFIPFEREVSIIAVRGRGGESSFYPVVENHHQEGMLRLTLAPAPDLTPELQSQAEEYAMRVMVTLNYVGVLAIEFFQHEGRLLANEMAPRVHNSGHWTIEGAGTSQFENHLRAIIGLPLGSTALTGYCAMLNIIGTLPDHRSVFEVPDSHLHLYGKAPRPNRKLGHITIRTKDPVQLHRQLSQLRAKVGQ